MAKHTDDNGNGIADAAEQEWLDHDPVADPAFPRITAYSPSSDDPVWPEEWASDEEYEGPTRGLARGFNLRDYSHDASARGWGSGWPRCASSSAMAAVTADRSGTRVSVRREIAVMTDALLDATEARGYLLKPASCGGFNCRQIAGTNRPSNHSWGLAVDLNWGDNPYTTTGRHSMPEWVPRMWNRYGWAWGGDYQGARRDFMHLEQMAAVAEVPGLTTLALRELAGGAAPAPAPTPSGGTLRRGSTGDAVKRLQSTLKAKYRAYAGNLVVDGDYGPATEAAVREFQRRSGLTADGIAGPVTLRALGL